MTHLRGHAIRRRGGQFVYIDTGELTTETWRFRPCGHCGRHTTGDGYDPCTGMLSGVVNACCGHGHADEAYIQFANGSRIDGAEALAKFDEMSK